MKLSVSILLISLIQKARSVGVGAKCNYASSIFCDSGLLCSIKGDLPDAPHFCTKPSSVKEGQQCHIMYSTECEDGLVCAKKGYAPDAVTVCKKPDAAKEGEKCDSIHGIECDSQLLCAKDGLKSDEGICEKRKDVKKDQVCNGYTLMCENGFTCAKNDAAREGPRICKETAPKTVKEGETCGGKIDVSMNLPTVCESGLTCKTDPALPDVPGVCLKYVGEGQGCGGLNPSSPRCENGLSCFVGDSQSKDLPGVCKKGDAATPPPLIDIVGVGHPCGEVKGIVKKCYSGLECSSSGVCQDPTATTETLAPVSTTASQDFPLTSGVIVDPTATTSYPRTSDDAVNSANTLSSVGLSGILAFLLF